MDVGASMALFFFSMCLLWVILYIGGIYGLYKLGKRWPRLYMQYILPAVFVVGFLFWLYYYQEASLWVLLAMAVLTLLAFGAMILRARRQGR
jgi:hypothetical protein